jgi:hypothetical protein
VIISFSAGMKRRPGGAKMTYRPLTAAAAAVLPVIEKDLKLVCQESAMVVRFHPPGSFNILTMTLLLLAAKTEHQEILN